jgi:putative protease
MGKKEVGKITHFFDKISVGVVELNSGLSVGDKISIEGHDNVVEQKVGSMQLEHEAIEKAKKGQAVGMKVDQPVKAGDTVYKLTE